MYDIGCSQAFYVYVREYVDGQEDADVADNMLSLSQGHYQALGDDNELVSTT